MQRKSLVFSGLHAMAAEAVSGVVDAGRSAAGSTNADAAPITADVTTFTTVGAGQGAILPNCDIGDSFEVHNAQATNALLVYPPAGVSINALTATTQGFSIATNRGAVFRRVSATNFRVVYGA